MLRIVGLNWDQGYHLHPDERFLTMVALDIQWPQSISQYFDTSISPLNPHNKSFDFFVYGLWPVLLVKAVSQAIMLHDYSSLNLVGRVLSAIVDTATVLVIYKTVLYLARRRLSAFLASATYSLFVLPLQLSHYFATDPYLNFCLALTLYLLTIFLSVTRPWRQAILIGLTFGLAVSAKVSAVLFAPIIVLGFVIHLFRFRALRPLFFSGLIMSVVIFVTLHLFYPYLFSGFFTPNPKLLANWQQLKFLEVPSPHFPPSVQWADTQKFIFPLLNLFFVGLGPVWSLVFVAAIISQKWIRNSGLWLVLTWTLLLFLLQGSQAIKPLRYLLPIFPGLAIMIGFYLGHLPKRVILFTLLIGSVWGLGFLSVYTHPHPRVAASEWMYKNIPAGTTISCDLWDDCLPLSNRSYTLIETRPFDPDSTQYLSKLSQIQYLAISSNRTYGSVTHKPDFYPQTSVFYTDLFSSKAGFKKIAEFTSRPGFAIPGIHFCFTPPILDYGRVAGISCDTPGIWLVDDFVDESFTVYDHPRVTIFEKTSSLEPKI